jgi:hypothetical protein
MVYRAMIEESDSIGDAVRQSVNPGAVLESIPNNDRDRCVDLFQRSDGTFGFNEFRKDPEDRGGWTLTANHSDLVFTSKDAALSAARTAVIWLRD